MRLLVLSTNQQRDENILPVVKVLYENHGVICDFIETHFYNSANKPFYINEIIKVESTLFGKKSELDVTDNNYKKRFKNLSLLKSFLSKSFLAKYDALLIGSDDYLGRYFLKKFRGKKRFLIQDGLFFNITSALIYNEILKGNRKTISSALFFLKYFTKESLIKVFDFFDISYLFFSYSGKSEFDLFFVSGKYTQNLLSSQGVSNDRIFLSGIPRFKYLFKDAPVSKLKEAPFRNEAAAVTFMTGAYKNHSQYEMDACEKKFLKGLCILMKKFAPNVELYIKVHPRDAVGDFEQFAANGFVTLITNTPIEQILVQSDIILANASTTTVEAAFFDTPVIITLVSFIQTFVFKSYYSYDRNYYCVAETWQELEDYVVKILGDEKYKQDVINKQRKLTEALICSQTRYSEASIANEIYSRVKNGDYGG